MPISVRCPSCDTKLKIQNAAAVGKKVRCPKCEQAFTVKAPRQAPEEDEYEDYGDFDDLEDSSDDAWDDDFSSSRSRRSSGTKRSSGGGGRARSATRSRGSKGGKKKKKASRNKATAGSQKTLLLGGGALLVIGLAVALFIIFKPKGAGADGNFVDLTWIPADRDVIAYVDVKAILNHPEIKPQLEGSREFQRAVEEGKEQGFDLMNDIESITVGAKTNLGGGGFGPPIGQNDMVIVMRTARPIDEKKDATEATHNGATYWKSTKQRNLCVYRANSTTYVLGTETAVTAAIDTKGATVRRPEFDFVDSGQEASFAWVPKDRSIFAQIPDLNSNPQAAMVGAFEPEGFKALGEALNTIKSDGTGFAVGMKPASKSYDINLQIGCANGKGSELSTSLGTIVTRAKALYTQFAVPQLSQPGMDPKVKTLADDFVNSLSSSGGGSSASLAMTFPILKEGDLPKGGMNSFPGVPGFGDFNPFGAIGEARSAARNASSKNNLKQIGLAMHNYHETWSYMPIRKVDGNANQFSEDGKPKLSWRVHLLPYVEEAPLYNQFKLDEPWDSPHNKALISRMPDVFKSPQRKTKPGETCYLALTGPGGAFEGGQGFRFRDFTDGTSNTLLVVEADESAAVTWTKPSDYEFDISNPKRWLTKQFLGLLADGSVRTLEPTIDAQTLLRLFQRNDGQLVNF